MFSMKMIFGPQPDEGRPNQPDARTKSGVHSGRGRD